jgi:hypothetical protein
VAVEKVVFFKNRLKLGDRKCLPDPRRSFIAQPDAFYFCEFSEKEFFNTHGIFQQPPPDCWGKTHLSVCEHLLGFYGYPGSLSRVGKRPVRPRATVSAKCNLTFTSCPT